MAQQAVCIHEFDNAVTTVLVADVILTYMIGMKNSASRKCPIPCMSFLCLTRFSVQENIPMMYGFKIYFRVKYKNINAKQPNLKFFS